MLVPTQQTRSKVSYSSNMKQIKRIRTLCLVGEEGVNLGRRAVVRDDVEALVVHVENQVLAL